jgi:AP-1-like factor
MSRQNPQLTPAQQDLLLAALASNSKSNQPSSASVRAGSVDSMAQKAGENGRFDPNAQTTPPSGHFDFAPDESPYLDFDIDGEGDEQYDFDINAQMIGDLPESSGDLHDKRKSIDGKDDEDEGGGKKRESEDKSGKKPGRKPLTSEPTTVSMQYCFGMVQNLTVDAEA